MCTRPRQQPTKCEWKRGDQFHTASTEFKMLNPQLRKPARRLAPSLQYRACLQKCVVQVLFLFQDPFCVRDHVCKFLWGTLNRLI